MCCLTSCVGSCASRSLWFAAGANQAKCTLFEYDRRFASEPRFVFFDCDAELSVGESLAHSFDLVISDPPRVNAPTLDAYSRAMQTLSTPGAKGLLITSSETASYVRSNMGLSECVFKPHMPAAALSQAGLFSLYANYSDPALKRQNPAAPDPGDNFFDTSGGHEGPGAGDGHDL